MKVRAWDSSEKIMYEVLGIRWDQEDCKQKILIKHRNGTLWFFADEKKPFKLMWTIGEKTNKLVQDHIHQFPVEVYEGDILRWKDWDQEGTEKPDYYVVQRQDSNIGFQCYRNGKELDIFQPISDIFDFEIVGNIYENGDLLK